MQTFTLTRSDHAQAYRHATANLRAIAKRKKAAAAAAQGTLRRVVEGLARLAVWPLALVAILGFLQTRALGPQAKGYVLCIAITALVTLVLAYLAAVVMTRRQLQAQLSDDGTTLSPQSVAVSESGIEQHAKGAFSRLEWAFFLSRQEDQAMFYLFVEPAMCMMIPKSVLSAQEQALIERHVPLQER